MTLNINDLHAIIDGSADPDIDHTVKVFDETSGELVDVKEVFINDDQTTFTLVVKL